MIVLIIYTLTYTSCTPLHTYHLSHPPEGTVKGLLLQLPASPSHLHQMMPTLLTSSKFLPVPISVSVLFHAWLFFPLLWGVETLLCRITNRTVKPISAAACKDKWGDTWSNLCGSWGPSRNWHCDRWGDKWCWHNRVAWMSRGVRVVSVPLLVPSPLLPWTCYVSGIIKR